MEDPTNTASNTSKRYAVVTGGNKGIGFEICGQLAREGVVVVLTARSEEKGKEALEKLKGHCCDDGFVVFHQLDVVDPSSISSLVHFVKAKFGKLDILVNNAGVNGVVVANVNAFKASGGGEINWKDTLTHNNESIEECIQINYHGTKMMTQAFLPLLQLSKSPRIVYVTSGWAKLQNIGNEWAKGVLGDVVVTEKGGEGDGEKAVDEVVNVFLEDYKKGEWEEKGWCSFMTAYGVSKAAMNAYSRIIAHKYPSFQVNCVDPGHVKTDTTFNTGVLTAAEGASSVVRVALQPENGPSGVLFDRQQVISF